MINRHHPLPEARVRRARMPEAGFCIWFIHDFWGFRRYGLKEICNLGFWFVTSIVWKPSCGGGALPSGFLSDLGRSGIRFVGVPPFRVASGRVAS